MSKRIVVNIIALAIFIFFQGPVFGAAKQAEIRVKPGEKSIKINQYSVTAEKAFVKSSSLMIPLKTFAGLIGASLENQASQKTIIVFKNNRNIKFVIGKKIVYIDGIKKETPCEPVLVNGTIMVPLRVLAQCFNAVISKDSLTGEFVVVFPLENYQDRFSFIKDERIGDSYYGWSVSYPKGCVVDEKKPAGSSVLIKNIEKGYYYYIFNTTAKADLKDENLLNELESYVSDERIVRKDLTTKNNKKYSLIVLERENEICEYKATLKNGRLYQIHFYTIDKTGFLDEERGKVYQDIINSFDTDYYGDTKNVTDINEITNGMYTYTENSCGWNIDLPAEVNIDVRKSDYSFEILNERGRENGLTLGVDIYPIETGESLESYAKEKINSVYKDINKEDIPELAVKNSYISGKPAKKIYFKIDTGDESFYFFNSIIFDGQCKFHVYVYGKSGFFKGENLVLGDRIINSFSLPEKPIKVLSEDKSGFSTINYDSSNRCKRIIEKNGYDIIAKNNSGFAELQINKKETDFTIDIINKLRNYEKINSDFFNSNEKMSCG